MQTRETADSFLQLIIEVLADKGRAAVVLPDGTLFGEGKNQNQEAVDRRVQPAHHRAIAKRGV